mgnify:CR=1 FL=1
MMLLDHDVVTDRETQTGPWSGRFCCKEGIEYARTEDKDITCIFEFQSVGSHDLTEGQTYYNEGIDAAIASFENLYAKADYKKLKFAYHYLKPLQELVLDWQ